MEVQNEITYPIGGDYNPSTGEFCLYPKKHGDKHQHSELIEIFKGKIEGGKIVGTLDYIWPDIILENGLPMLKATKDDVMSGAAFQLNSGELGFDLRGKMDDWVLNGEKNETLDISVQDRPCSINPSEFGDSCNSQKEIPVPKIRIIKNPIDVPKKTATEDPTEIPIEKTGSDSPTDLDQGANFQKFQDYLKSNGMTELAPGDHSTYKTSLQQQQPPTHPQPITTSDPPALNHIPTDSSRGDPNSPNLKKPQKKTKTPKNHSSSLNPFSPPKFFLEDSPQLTKP